MKHLGAMKWDYLHFYAQARNKTLLYKLVAGSNPSEKY